MTADEVTPPADFGRYTLPPRQALVHAPSEQKRRLQNLN